MTDFANYVATMNQQIEGLRKLIAEAILAEREACAQIALNCSLSAEARWDGPHFARLDIAAAIRHRELTTEQSLGFEGGESTS